MLARFASCTLVLLAPLLTGEAAAQPTMSVVAPTATAAACLPGILAAERQFALPPKLLQTIGIVESGRIDPLSGRIVPWPWTIDVNGNGQVFETKQAAIEAVHALQIKGVQSIDVGCLQINLMHHPHAFASLDDAFDPNANTQYGARFLSALYRETGNWPQAAAIYHSRTEAFGVPYETRVMAMWPMAKHFPDATLPQRTAALSPHPDPVAALPAENANYTPEFAARVKQMRADIAKLEASTGLLASR